MPNNINVIVPLPDFFYSSSYDVKRFYYDFYRETCKSFDAALYFLDPYNDTDLLSLLAAKGDEIVGAVLNTRSVVIGDYYGLSESQGAAITEVEFNDGPLTFQVGAASGESPVQPSQLIRIPTSRSYPLWGSVAVGIVLTRARFHRRKKRSPLIGAGQIRG